MLVVKSSYILALQYKAVVFDDLKNLARQDGSFVATNPLLHTTTYSMAKGRTAGSRGSAVVAVARRAAKAVREADDRRRALEVIRPMY